MPYAAYSSTSPGPQFSFENRNEARGILGTLAGTGEPVVTADSLDDLRLRAKAHLADHPEHSLYLTDADKRVYDIILCQAYHEAIERRENYIAVVSAVCVFAVTCLVAMAFSGMGFWGLVIFLGAAGLYLTIVKFRINNALELAVGLEINLIVLLIMAARLFR